MREYIKVSGGSVLEGEVKVSGAKNAVLPLLIASLLTSEKNTYTNVPDIKDVFLTCRLLETFGAKTSLKGDRVEISVPTLTSQETSYSLVKMMRASFWVLGPLLARSGEAKVAFPGGDLIGARPVDIHLEGLATMGADIKVKHGVVHAVAKQGLKPTEFTFKFPSVGATHQLLLASCLTPGTSVFKNVAREPEVEALANLINSMGGDVEGAGTETLVVRGKEELSGTDVELIGDRIEAATYLLAAATTKGSVTVNGIEPRFMGNFLDILKQMDLDVFTTNNSISVKSKGHISPVNVITEPFPGFATDIQAPLMAALTVANGKSTVEEKIYEGRFGHVSELCRMGANITIDGRVATITGVDQLSSANVEGFDIRGAVAMIIAGLAADGDTEIYEPQHIRRGYSHLEEKFTSLGARISSHIKDAEDYLFTGC